MDEVAGVDTEDLRQLEDVVERRIPLSPLHLTEVTPVQARLLGELLLTLPKLVTARADPLAELARGIRQRRLGHGRSHHVSSRCV